MKRHSAWSAPVATDAELWLRRIVVLQGILPAPLLTLAVLAHLLLRGAGAKVPGSLLVTAFVALTAFEFAVIVLWVRARRRSRASLTHARFMICPSCHYALTASSPQGLCPECGRPYDSTSLQLLWLSAYWTGLDPPHLPDNDLPSKTSMPSKTLVL